MNILSTRFGLIQASETDVITDSGRIAGLPLIQSFRPSVRPGRDGSVMAAERDGPRARVRAGARRRWPSATTGSSSARVTARPWSWTTNGPHLIYVILNRAKGEG